MSEQQGRRVGYPRKWREWRKSSAGGPWEAGTISTRGPCWRVPKQSPEKYFGWRVLCENRMPLSLETLKAGLG